MTDFYKILSAVVVVSVICFIFCSVRNSEKYTVSTSCGNVPCLYPECDIPPNEGPRAITCLDTSGCSGAFFNKFGSTCTGSGSTSGGTCGAKFENVNLNAISDGYTSEIVVGGEYGKPSSKEKKDWLIVRLYAEPNCGFKHPLTEIWWRISDAMLEFPIIFEYISADKLPNKYRDPLPLIVKIKHGQALKYHGLSDYGQLYDWILNDNLFGFGMYNSRCGSKKIHA